MGSIARDTDFQDRMSKATAQLAENLETLLGQFDESQQDEARIGLANYTLGYMGVHYGLTI